jgi:carbamoyl-phosphate synthase large subunit
VPIAKIAARVMAGEKLAAFDLQQGRNGHVAVKEAVFPFARFPGVDVMLGPEMRSTGEVMGLDRDFARAFLKSQTGAGVSLPSAGRVFLSVRDRDKPAITALARSLIDMGFVLVATAGTAKHLESAGVAVEAIKKVYEGRPNVVDAMISGTIADSFSLRRTALVRQIPYYTTLSGARAAVQAIAALRRGQLEVAPLQSYFRGSF